jgi:hypothetical protein
LARTLGLAGAARVRAADEPMTVAARTIEIYRSVFDEACRRVA